MCVCAAKNSDFALAKDAVVIDLSDLNTVTVDVQSKVCVLFDVFSDCYIIYSDSIINAFDYYITILLSYFNGK